MSLLEFIGDFTDAEGEWTDPIVLEQELTSQDDVEAKATDNMADAEPSASGQSGNQQTRFNPG